MRLRVSSPLDTFQLRRQDFVGSLVILARRFLIGLGYAASGRKTSLRPRVSLIKILNCSFLLAREEKLQEVVHCGRR